MVSNCLPGVTPRASQSQHPIQALVQSEIQEPLHLCPPSVTGTPFSLSAMNPCTLFDYSLPLHLELVRKMLLALCSQFIWHSWPFLTDLTTSPSHLDYGHSLLTLFPASTLADTFSTWQPKKEIEKKTNKLLLNRSHVITFHGSSCLTQWDQRHLWRTGTQV